MDSSRIQPQPLLPEWPSFWHNVLKEVAGRYPQHPLLPALHDRLATLDTLSQKLAGPH